MPRGSRALAKVLSPYDLATFSNSTASAMVTSSTPPRGFLSGMFKLDLVLATTILIHIPFQAASRRLEFDLDLKVWIGDPSKQGLGTKPTRPS